jgi:poly(3-hydroxybutyrate) depolymerase
LKIKMAPLHILLSSLILTVTLHICQGAQPKLKHYNVDASKITVSGISSGAAMATQYHFAHSAEVNGAGIVAGVPYCCGIGGLGAATTCMTTPNLVSVNFLISEANTLESRGYIDSTANIRGDKVFIFHGAEDSTVRPGSGPNVQEMYAHYGAQIRTEFTKPAEHGFPTNNYGSPCGSNSASTAYLNNCGYKGAYELLNYLYDGGLMEPQDNDGILANLLNYDQAEFFVLHPSYSSMSTDGFIYVPTACQSGAQCKLHISFHGCMQSKGNVGNIYASKAGFMEVAEKNNIIVLFPQIAATPVNLTSCWDWFGYLNTLFATKDGNQVLATYRMMNRVVKG